MCRQGLAHEELQGLFENILKRGVGSRIDSIQGLAGKVLFVAEVNQRRKGILAKIPGSLCRERRITGDGLYRSDLFPQFQDQAFGGFFADAGNGCQMLGIALRQGLLKVGGR